MEKLESVVCTGRPVVEGVDRGTYEAPKLTILGNLVDLTLSGSGNLPEGIDGDDTASH
jgi:hypothetical protein